MSQHKRAAVRWLALPLPVDFGFQLQAVGELKGAAERVAREPSIVLPGRPLSTRLMKLPITGLFHPIDGRKKRCSSATRSPKVKST